MVIGSSALQAVAVRGSLCHLIALAKL
jgi:hypothetical protein